MGEKTLSASERPGQEYMDRLVKVNVELLLGPKDARVRAFPFVAFRQLAWLYQEYICDMFSRMQEERLCYHEVNNEGGQCNERKAITKVNKLPSSWIGGEAHRRKMQRDAFCLVRSKGSPSFFLMCTANPTWPEIQREMKPNEKAHDRPDLVARIFKIKLKQLLADMWAGKCFGTAVYVVGVI